MTDMIQISRAELTRIHALLGAHLGEEAVAALSKTSKTIKAAKAEKKPRANAGQGTAWSAFSSKIQQDHKEEVDAVKAEAAAARKAAKESGAAAPAETQGAHLHWCSRYKEAHDAEWQAFKAAWELEHPKGSAAGSVADDASVAESAAPSDADGAAADKKPRKPQSEETKKAAAAKRAATKAAKATAAPADAPAAAAQDEVVEEAAVDLPADEEEAEDDILPFSKGGKDYLRWGHLDKDGDEVWAAAGYTWLKNADGSKGAYAGKMVGNKLDNSPAAMAEEPEFE